MGVSKVIYDGEPIMDLTSDTVTENNLLRGATAHGADGEAITGIANGIYYIVGNSTTDGEWTGTCDGITEYYDGLTIAYRTNIAGVSGGTTLNINGLGAAAVRRNVSAVTTHYGVNTLLHLTYTTIDGVGYWQMADYDSNTKTSAGTSNKTGSKMYIVGGTSQSSSGVTTYSNKNVYIGTDNCLYSNGKKVTVEDDVNTLIDAKTPVTPQRYGAMGDGTDATQAFINALANNRKVYVPSGTYTLADGIVIRDNCELELAQDAVLNFTQTSGNCITLNMSSSLKGNHATINVPYAFSGNVIYADTTTTTSTNIVPPFIKWSPQWKSGRYVTDLNICKADSRGFHYSVDGDTYGTAVYISANGDKGGNELALTFMWGVHYSGLRIAGGFKYGIRAVNFNNGWNHEMRIDAFIDACEIGVSLEDCNNAYVSAIVQPRRAYSAANVYSPYAKHGIELIDSRNTDLSGSRVWDWNETSTLWTSGGEYQHIAMKGDCSGTILNDFLYYESAIDIRDLIYTDTPSNLEKINILQEPFTRWFKPIDGVPYFSDGFSEKQVALAEDIDRFFTTDKIPQFTDALATAIDTDGSIFKGIGYTRTGFIATDGTFNDNNPYNACTGFIPLKDGEIMYVEGFRYDGTATGEDRIVVYDRSFTKLAHINEGLIVGGTDARLTYTAYENGFSLILHHLSNAAYIRFSIRNTELSDYPVISVGTPITYTEAGFLVDSVKVKAENVIGGSGGGGTSIDVTAEVGQTIIVKEVDANGKPTMWESADYQPRTHYTAQATLLPETAFVNDDEMGFRIEGNIELVEGKSYTVIWNGVEYTTTAVNAQGMVFLGNVGAVTGGDDSGEPFVIVSAQDIVMAIPLDGSEAVTLSISGEYVEKIPAKYIDGKLPYDFEIYFYNDDDIQTFVTPENLRNAVLSRRPIFAYINILFNGLNKTHFGVFNGYINYEDWGEIFGIRDMNFDDVYELKVNADGGFDITRTVT